MKERNGIKLHLPIIIGIFTAFLIVVYTYSLRFNDLSPYYFHALYLITLLCGAIVVFNVLKGIYKNILTIFLFFLFIILCLRLVDNIRTSETVLYYPDLNYESQIIENILSFGHIDTSGLTGTAKIYVYYPALELLLANLNLISGIEPTLLLKFFGSFLGLLTIVFIERFYFRLFKSARISVPAAFFTGLCPLMISFGSYTIHQPLALLFFSIFLWTITRITGCSVKWFSISLLSVFIIVISHHLSTYILILFLILVIAFTLIYKLIFRIEINKLLNRYQLFVFTFLLIVVVTAVILYTPPPIEYYLQRYHKELSQNIFLIESYTTEPVVPKGIKPEWMVYLDVIGFAVFSLFLIEFSKCILRKNKEFLTIILFATSGISIFAFFMVMEVFNVVIGSIGGRSIIYFYFFTTPLFIVFIRNLSSSKWLKHFFKTWKVIGQKSLRISIIILLFLPTVTAIYHGEHPMMYDSTASYSARDVRLPQRQWQSAAEFSKDKDELNWSWGVSIAWSYVGGLGNKEIIPLAIETNLSEFADSHPNKYVFLRKSMTEIPDYGNSNPDETEFSYVLGKSDLIYSTGEVILIKT